MYVRIKLDRSVYFLHLNPYIWGNAGQLDRFYAGGIRTPG